MRGTMKRTTMYLGEEQYDRLDRLSERSGIVTSELIRRALDFYLATEDRFRRLGLPMGDLDGLLDAVRKEEQDEHSIKHTAMLEHKITLLLEKLERVMPDNGDSLLNAK